MTPSDVSAPTALASESDPDKRTPTLRRLEIEEASNRLVVHRISLAILPYLERAGVSPNFVSCMGALSGLAAALAYFHYENAWACLFGFVFMVAWHVFDGADGQLARRTGQTSQAGFVIDGICDYLTFLFVYVALGTTLSSTVGPSVWLLVIGAALCHAVQAAAFEMQRETYLTWVSAGPSQIRRDNKRDVLSGLTAILSSLYCAVQVHFRPLPTTLQDEFFSCNAGQQHTGLSDAYRQSFRRNVLSWSLLSANNRTIAIFLFCLSGEPLLYFMYEIFVLNAVLLALIFYNHVSRRSFVRAIA